MTSPAETTTEALAEVVAGAGTRTFADATRARIADTFTDSVAIGFRAASRPVTTTLRRFVMGQWRDGDAVVLGSSGRLSPTGAALCNGHAIHSLELDDIGRPSHSHPSCHLVPAILAAGSAVDIPANELVTAFAVGFEVEARLSVALGGYGHPERGWHPTATLGTMGSAAAAGRILGLDVAGIRNTLGIAASMAGGLRAGFGTDVKPLHAGLAAQAGVAAALLTRDGLRASPDAIESEGGFVHAFRADAVTAATVDQPDDDEAWFVDKKAALSMKPYPTCGATHAAIEAAIIAHGQIEADRIESIDVAVSTRAREVLRYSDPRTPQERQFSLPFTTASAIVHGRFDQESLDREPTSLVRHLTARCRWIVDDRVERAVHFGCVLTVHLRDGDPVEVVVPVPRGRDDRWPDPAFLVDRFVDALEESGVGRDEALTLHGRLSRIADTDERVGDLLTTLARTSSIASASRGGEQR